MPNDYFEVLGLPRRYSIDADEVERNYLARSRQVHPDFHADAGTAGQQASTEVSAALNEAKATVRDPFRRAEYLLSLLGGPSAADAKEMPQAFLMEVLDLREEIEQAKTAGNTATKSSIQDRIAEQRRELLDKVARQFEAASQGGDQSQALKAIRGHLNSVKYLQGLLRDLKSE